MRTVKIVADSSANLMELKTVAFDAAPLKIITAQREFVDDRNLDLDEMIGFFKSYKGRSQSSCPKQREEPYLVLTSRWPLCNESFSSEHWRQVVHGCRQLVS